MEKPMKEKREDKMSFKGWGKKTKEGRKEWGKREGILLSKEKQQTETAVRKKCREKERRMKKTENQCCDDRKKSEELEGK
uniref:Uncharacterized protein n=1 Tax=Octopus bimaculoides TaxID=37653 RepID=A0A0L8IFD8_OCTBM